MPNLEIFCCGKNIWGVFPSEEDCPTLETSSIKTRSTIVFPALVDKKKLIFLVNMKKYVVLYDVCKLIYK